MTFSALDSELTGPLFATDAMRAVFSDRRADRGDAPGRGGAGAGRGEARTRRRRSLRAGDREDHAGGPRHRRARPRDRGRRRSGHPLRQGGRGAAAGEAPRRTSISARPARTSSTPRSSCRWREAFDLIADDLAAILAGPRAARRSASPDALRRPDATASTPRRSPSAMSPRLWLAGIAEVAADLPAHPRARRWSPRSAVRSARSPALGDKGPAVIGGVREGARPRRAAGRLARAPRPDGRDRRLAGDADRGARQDGDRRRPACRRPRSARSPEPHVAGPRRLVGDAAQAEPDLVDRHPRRARRRGGHVVTLLDAMAAGVPAAGRRWHAEWHALPQLFGLASGALREARRLAEGLVVDPTRMRANLDLTRGLLFAGRGGRACSPRPSAGGAAHELVERAADVVRDTGRPLRRHPQPRRRRTPQRARAKVAGRLRPRAGDRRRRRGRRPGDRRGRAVRRRLTKEGRR